MMNTTNEAGTGSGSHDSMNNNNYDNSIDERGEGIHESGEGGDNNERLLLLPSGNSGDHEDSAAKKRPNQPKKNKSITETEGVFNDPREAAASRAAKKKNQRLAKKEKAMETMIKYGALLLLVGQMVGLVLLMRYSRTVPRPPDTPLYLASSAVFTMEVLKLVLCTIVVMIQTQSEFMNEMKFHILESPTDMLKLCVPSLLYTIQNNLLYLALTNLDAATYQVCYQLKILTTALFSAVLLGRTFSTTKWLSLVLLTVGVAIVEVSGSGDQHTNSTANALSADGMIDESKNRFIGIIAVVCAACTSGFSGVYFEKILKASNTSLWIRNIQMGIPSVIIAYITVYFKDSVDVQKYGFFGGYTMIVWTVVIVQAVGGLIVATVVKYADNVLKVFATSFSIIISCIISAFLFDFHPSVSFLIGASLVVTATVMYSSPERKERKSILPMNNNSKPRK